MYDSQVVKKVAGQGLRGFFPAGKKAATTAEVLVRGCELGGVMAVSASGGLTIMLVLIIAIAAMEYVFRKVLRQEHSGAPHADVAGHKWKGRGLRRLASMTIPAGGMSGRSLRRMKALA